MDKKSLANRLQALGKREAAALRQLAAIAKERCSLLTEVAEGEAIEGFVIEPKD